MCGSDHVLNPPAIHPSLSGGRKQLRICIWSYSQTTVCVRATWRASERQQVLQLRAALSALVVLQEEGNEILSCAARGMNCQA